MSATPPDACFDTALPRVSGARLAANVRFEERLRCGTIAAESRALANRVRAGETTPADLTGATFTVSNLGMFGMTAINPPQAAILGVGAARPTIARVDGEIVDRQLLTLTLSCDHRILNGADGSRFLADVKTLLQTPLRLAFDSVDDVRAATFSTPAEFRHQLGSSCVLRTNERT
jgi:pyruvate dehydrogenase E2 component (dihydrolipoamide acetyltransferase)